MFKILKQELLFIPIMFIIIELFRGLVQTFYPETALFDRGSELETFLFSVWQIVWISSVSWILVAIAFPKASKALKQFYNRFETFTTEYQETFAMKLFLVFFFGLVFLLSGKAQTIGYGQTPGEVVLRKHLYDTLHAQLNVREATNNNDGLEVERYLSFVKRKKGDAWCAAFTSYNLHAIGIPTPPNPTTAWAPSFANSNYIVWSNKLAKMHQAKQPKVGDCFTLFYAKANRVGHVGYIVGGLTNYFITIEGNTAPSGTREGSGVYKLKRPKAKVYAVTDYITPYLTNYDKASIYKHKPVVNDKLPTALNKNRKRNRYHQRVSGHTEGLLLVRRFVNESESGYCHNKGRCESGQQWPSEHAGDDSGNRATESKRADYKWQAASRLCLQRTGVYNKRKKPPYTKIVFAKAKLPPFAKKTRHQVSTIYT